MRQHRLDPHNSQHSDELDAVRRHASGIGVELPRCGACTRVR
jgi:hypothetical protein